MEDTKNECAIDSTLNVHTGDNAPDVENDDPLTIIDGESVATEYTKNEGAINSALNVCTSDNARDVENDGPLATIDVESVAILSGNSCSVTNGGEELKLTVEETNSDEIEDEEIMDDDEYDEDYIIGDEDPVDEELLEDPEEDANYEENEYEEVLDEEINKDIMDTDGQDPEEEELEEENVNKEVSEECMERNDDVEVHVGDLEKGDMKEGDKNVENASNAEMNAETNNEEVVKVNANEEVGQLKKMGRFVKRRKMDLKGKNKVISSEENLNIKANDKEKMKGKVETGKQGAAEEKPHENEEKKGCEDETRELKKNVNNFPQERKFSKLRKKKNMEATNDEKVKVKVETGTQGVTEEKQHENTGLENEKIENCENEMREQKKIVKNSPKEKLGKRRKRGKKGANNNKVLNGVSEMIPKNTKDQQPANNKLAKKGTYTGMIFMCSSKTKMDCYRLKVLGLPANKRDLVLDIYEGMKLFLFDFDLKLLYGIYRAAGPGGYNIEPKAFNSSFPSQVRFNISEDCLPLPEEKFKEVIKENYFSKSKFDCQLTAEQVGNLCKLFRASSKASKFKGLNRIPKPEPRALDGERSRKRPGREEPRNENRIKRQRRNEERARKRHQGQGKKSPIRREQRRRGRKGRTPPPAARALPLPPHPLSVLSHPYAYGGEHSARLDLLEIRHRERIEHEVRERGRDPIHQHYNGYFRDSEFRHQEEIQHRSPYDRYRDYPSYNDRSYAPAGSSSYHQTAGSSHYPSGGRVEHSMYDHYNSTGRGRLWY